MTSLSIESLAYGGDAIAHLADGRTAFVSGAVPGDVVEARDHRGARTLRASPRPSRFVDPSPDRVTPPVPLLRRVRRMPVAARRLRRPTARQAPRRRRRAHTHRPHRRRRGHRRRDRSPPRPSTATATRSSSSSTRHRAGRASASTGPAPTRSSPSTSACCFPKDVRKAPKALGGALRYLAGEQDLGLTRVALRVGATHQGRRDRALGRARPVSRARPPPRRSARRSSARASCAS